MGGDFSGSSTVTSRNPLIHNGATNATRSPRFDAEGGAPCRSWALAAELGGTLATTNFREDLFFSPRTSVKKPSRMHWASSGGTMAAQGRS